MDKKGPFSAVGTLVSAGRFREAAGALKQSAMAGAQVWETFLWLGRIAEGKGRLREAERAYRKALLENQDSNPLEREFARFLESCGRFKESETHLLRAMELGWPREEGDPALTRLRRKSLERSLLADGKFEAAAKALEAGACESLEGGAVLWPKVFSALLCEHGYHSAFRLGDAMLRKSTRLANANVFLWPWWFKVSSRFSDKKVAFCAQELERVRKARSGGGFSGWFAYCSGILLLGLGRQAEALVEYERVKRLRSPRYSLMHHPFVMHRLLIGDFKWTIKTCRSLLKNTPDYWWFQCRLAEALMADGDVAGGLQEFERAARIASEASARGAIMTWHGAALLWTGEYRKALEKFDEAVAIGTKNWAHCWRGGAYLLLGEHRKALADLDKAIEADPQDLEAFLWRGEAYRLLGRNAEALRDLDLAIAFDSGYGWAYFNRALARHALGDAKGMAEDFAMIPVEVVTAIRGGLGMSAGDVLAPKEVRRVLESGLARAKGIRRPETYLNHIWMGRLSRASS